MKVCVVVMKKIDRRSSIVESLNINFHQKGSFQYVLCYITDTLYSLQLDKRGGGKNKNTAIFQKDKVSNASVVCGTKHT